MSREAIKPSITEKTVNEIRKEVNDVITTYFGHKLTQLTGEDAHLDDNDKKTIIFGLALKLSYVEIQHIITEERKERGLAPITINLTYYRSKYSELIDEVYATAIVRIGDIYRFSDKLYRISRYNELAEILHIKTIEALSLPIVTEMATKTANVYIKVLDRINVEMGSKSLADGIKRLPTDEEGEDGISTKDVKTLLKDILHEKYSNQLPIAISKKVDFTDYTNCVFAEKFGENIVCWHTELSKKCKGGQCAVQAGEMPKCGKFLNMSLLNNKDWLSMARERGCTTIDIIKLVGGIDIDQDLKERVFFYMKKHNIYKIPVIVLKDERKDDLELEEQMKNQEQVNVIEVD